MEEVRLDEAAPFSEENWLNLLECLNFEEKPDDCCRRVMVCDSSGKPICPLCHYKTTEEKEKIYCFLCGYRKAKDLIGGIENKRNGLQQ